MAAPTGCLLCGRTVHLGRLPVCDDCLVEEAANRDLDLLGDDIRAAVSAAMEDD